MVAPPRQDNKKLFDSSEIRRTLSILVEPGQVFELRVLEASTQSTSRFTDTLGGYFDNANDAIQPLSTIRSALGFYITLQRCQPDLLGRASNKLIKLKKDYSTPDNLVLGYNWLPIDCDPERISQISSTDMQHEKALTHSQSIREEVRKLGWPDPLLCDSGNGAHLLYRIDLANTPDNTDLVKRVLERIAAQFDVEGLHIDKSVFNPSRIWKLYGTLACKGDDTPKWPHRRSRILEVPTQLTTVTKEMLEAIAVPSQTAQHPTRIPSFSSNRQTSILQALDDLQWLEQWIRDHNITVGERQDYQGGYKWPLPQCPFCGESDHNANLFLTGNGYGYKCSHNRCNGKNWQAFRTHYEPDAYTRRNVITQPERIQQPSQSQSKEQMNGHKPASGNDGNDSPTTGISTSDDDISFILDCLQKEEWGDALLFAHLFKGLALYDVTEKEWYLYHGHAWERDEAKKVRHFVSGQLAARYIEVAAKIRKRPKETDEQKLKDEKLEKALLNRARELRFISRCNNVLNFVISLPGLAIKATQWDTHRWLLALPNGVLDLHTGECHPGNPTDYIRMVCPTLWQGLHAPAPRWEQFLQEIFEDRKEQDRGKLIVFVQRLLGYGITGEVREHVFTVFYGANGFNGKDTLQHGVSHTLGLQSGVMSKDVFLDPGRSHSAGAPTPHLVDLQGKRLAWASEPDKGARFSIGQMKELSGGQKFNVRPPHAKFSYEIEPTHLLILLTNHKPHADADDNPFWKRLRLISFNMTFKDNPEPGTNERAVDPTLWLALEAEASGILAWLVRGCLEWQQVGLACPQFVLDDGQAYREEEDTLGEFIKACCKAAPKARVQANKLYETYTLWCKDNNLHAMNGTLFGRQMGKRFEKKIIAGKTIYCGIGVPDPTGDPTPPDDDTDSLRNSLQEYNSAPDVPLDSQPDNDCRGLVGVSQKVQNTRTTTRKIENPAKLPPTPYSSLSEGDINEPPERDEWYVDSSQNSLQEYEEGTL